MKCSYPECTESAEPLPEHIASELLSFNLGIQIANIALCGDDLVRIIQQIDITTATQQKAMEKGRKATNLIEQANIASAEAQELLLIAADKTSEFATLARKLAHKKREES